MRHNQVDEHFQRLAEVDQLIGDATKARRVLGWRPTCAFTELVAEMVRKDLEATRNARVASMSAVTDT